MIATGSPTGVSENSWNGSMGVTPGSRLCASIRPCTTTLVLVPTSVQTPPRIAAYDSGRNSRDGARPCRRANADTSGIATATSGVLLTKALIAAAGATTRAWAAISERGGCASRRPASRPTAPLCRRPATTT